MSTHTKACLFVLLLAVCVVSKTTAKYIKEPCAFTSECKYEGGVCWEIDSCKLGYCLCDFGYKYIETACVKEKMIGESCTSSDECSSDSKCQGGYCRCYSSEQQSNDNTSCYRKYGESCSADSACYGELICQDNVCGCNEYSKYTVARTLYNGVNPKCVENTSLIQPLRENSICDPWDDTCDSGLTCLECPGELRPHCAAVVGPMATTTTVATTTITTTTTTTTTTPLRSRQLCTSSEECNYEGGACWKVGQCEPGVCLCMGGLFLVNGQCIKLKLIGEQCEIGSYCTIGSGCLGGFCSCNGLRESVDRTSCHRKFGESCTLADFCMHPLKCLNGTCGCLDSKHASVFVFGHATEKCIPKYEPYLMENDPCDMKNDHCGGANLICGSCPNSMDIARCFSTHVVKVTTTRKKITVTTAKPKNTTENELDGKIDVLAKSVTTAKPKNTTENEFDGKIDVLAKSGVEQVSMVVWVIGCLSLSATLVVKLY